MNTVPEEKLIVKLYPDDWFYNKQIFISSYAREVLLSLNCFLYLMKIRPWDHFFYEISLSSLIEVAGLDKQTVLEAINELIYHHVLARQSENVVCFYKKGQR
ncbi:hypothetical protein COMNV_01334 [Commensalibacter sp. Nvir]|uniref:hypothetical protein n=1 Tax=Commensalibacter sp. Nvir TaxID=3069817 RepID=UPI002D5D7D13|nr:hypothetical protein COMNV_01334 [Commensalibacter sp. Nvir]